jgi:short-subunit dehydrogenase
LITGASSGIGEAFADVFAAEGFDLIIVARREDRLQAVAERLRRQSGVQVDAIVCDLSRTQASEALCEAIAARGLRVDVLVNNAGYGVPGSYVSSGWARHAAQLQVMLVGLSELTHRMLPGMIERRYGRIINVASLAGLVPAPAGHTLYGATKAFVIKFSEALAREVESSGIHVTALCPGFTRSEFHDVTGVRTTVSRLPSWLWMDAPTVARQGFDAVMAGTPIYINGRVNRTVAALARLLPQTIVSALARRTGGRYRRVD